MEESILEAIKKRQEEFKTNIETMTLKKCRNVLEADLGLKPGDLGSHKEYVRDLIEKMVVNPPPEPAPKASKPASKASKPSSRAHKETASDAKQKKRKAPESKQQGGKEYGSKAQKLKRVCKAATIAVPPSVYTRVTSEQDVVDRLKDLLSKHGLSKDSTADEIAQVKRTLKKERDLDGINTENIVEGGRRRQARAVPSDYSAAATESDEEDTTRDENEEPGNGESYSAGFDGGEDSVIGYPDAAGTLKESECDAVPKAGAEVQSGDDEENENAAAEADEKQSMHKKPASGKGAKRLADWSESDDE